MRTYTDDFTCTNCQRDTPHECVTDDHERDSSNDIRTCTACGWYYHGFDGRYHPPLQDDGDPA